MIVKGSELEFISWVLRDGSGVKEVPERLLNLMQDDFFTLIGLSITLKTYIATDNMNVFVVRIKNN